MIFKLELNEQQIAILGQIIGKAPYEVAAPLITEMQKQIDAQQPKGNGAMQVGVPQQQDAQRQRRGAQ